MTGSFIKMIEENVAQKQKEGDTREPQVIAVEYNDEVIYPNKVRKNLNAFHIKTSFGFYHSMPFLKRLNERVWFGFSLYRFCLFWKSSFIKTTRFTKGRWKTCPSRMGMCCS